MTRLAVVALCISTIACGQRDRATTAMPLEACRIGGIAQEARCGWLAVPEDRLNDDGRKIRLRVVRIPARAESPAGALFLLAGGPGQAASEAFPALWPALAPIAETRDVVMIDQRGTGQSTPLDCRSSPDLRDAFRPGALADVARACLETVAMRNLPRYSTSASAEDLEAARVALGYSQIDLLGISYGTRLAMTYAALHADRARTLVLDAVVPPEMIIGATFARDADAALDGVLSECRSQSGCEAAFPKLDERVQRYLDLLGREPVTMDVRHPKTNAPLGITMPRASFAAALRGMLYSPELVALLPLSLEQLESGHHQAFVAQVAMLGESVEEHMSLGLMLSIVCAEDLPSVTEEDVAAEQRTRFGPLVEELRGACAVWPVAPRPSSPHPGAIFAPALVLSGALDPATPPRWGTIAMKHLSKGKHVIVPQAGHGVTSRGCVPKLIQQFIESANASSIDESCVERHRRPPFFIDLQGPRE